MKILVPMDLTDVSLNGLDYAMSRFPAASFTILHVLSGMLEVNPAYHVKPGVTRDLQSANELEALIMNHMNLKEMPSNMTVEVYYGEPVNVVCNYLKDHIYEAVVLGSRDKYDLFDKIFGTTSLGIVKKAGEPIYVIPRYATYKGYKKILVASNEYINDPDIIMALNYWNNTNAQIKFLHVSEKGDQGFDETKKVLLESLYESYQPPFSYEIEQIAAKNVVDSMLANAYNYKADLLIVIARKSSFLQALVYKSVSKEVIMKSAIPVLFLHTKKT